MHVHKIEPPRLASTYGLDWELGETFTYQGAPFAVPEGDVELVDVVEVSGEVSGSIAVQPAFPRIRCTFSIKYNMPNGQASFPVVVDLTGV